MDVPPIQYAHTKDGVSIAYAVIGTGPPLVLLETVTRAGIDLTIASPVFEDWFDRLSSSRSVVVFDWRGFGMSGSAPGGFSLNGFVNDVDAVVESISASTVDFHSQLSFCHVAVQYAAERPGKVRRMMLSQPAEGGGGARTSPAIELIWPISRQDWNLFCELWAHVIHGFGNPDSAELFAQRMSEGFTPDLLDELMDAIASMDSYASANEIDADVLVYVDGAGRQRAANQAAARALAAQFLQGRLVAGPSTSQDPSWKGRVSAFASPANDHASGVLRGTRY